VYIDVVGLSRPLVSGDWCNGYWIQIHVQESCLLTDATGAFVYKEGGVSVVVAGPGRAIKVENLLLLQVDGKETKSV